MSHASESLSPERLHEHPAAQRAVDELIARVGKTIVVGIPLGLGKPVPLVNALFHRAKEDPGIQLTLITALSLAIPRAGSDLQRRFLEPFVEREFKGVPEPAYIRHQLKGTLPGNIRILEFYFRPGAYLGAPLAQQEYISSNYTHVVRDMLSRGANVVMQMVAEEDGRLSLSCNPDLTIDIHRHMQAMEKPTCFVGMVNRELPFMPNDAEVDRDFFDILVDEPELEHRLFGVPNALAAPADHAVGAYAASLVADNGSLQIGIGSLGDSVAYMLGLRHRQNAQFSKLADALGIPTRYPHLLATDGGLGSFRDGQFAASEMFTWGLMRLYQQGVVKRVVYEHEGLQRLINEGRIEHRPSFQSLRALREAGIIADPLRDIDIEFLHHFGFIRDTVRPESIEQVNAEDLGDELRNGHVLHGGFILGPSLFYETLKQLPKGERARLNMMPVAKVNNLFGEEALERQQRLNARFINVCMKMTLSGAAVSDGLADGRVISGVGGQYNFVSMAHELEDARSILCLRAARESSDGPESNIVFNYGHITIPRHLRDIVITEYGIADLRGRTDAEVAAALIEVADSRFQQELVEKAKKAGKLPADWEVPPSARENTPEALQRKLQPFIEANLLPPFPLGTVFDATEVRLAQALTELKQATASTRGKLSLLRPILWPHRRDDDAAALERMGLASPRGIRERLLARLVIHGLRLADGYR
ncbi:MAG: acetyl-CoA hydrolase/transferase C-terminal domain-containing protein [Gammaproteobacteria bacterium]|nr:acetyl-CoA hydrolase/transferase C-terminal domain-containing protein [Gammaproteobacteria bacterium]